MNDFIDLILLIARKMLSVYDHKEASHAEERRLWLEEKFKADPAAPRVHSQELFEEFDVFLVQIKSTLDHMVKLMRRCSDGSGRCTRSQTRAWVFSHLCSGIPGSITSDE